MAQHRKKLVRIRRSHAAVFAFAPAVAIALSGTGVAMADTGGQSPDCHENVVCAPVNVGVNAPIDGIGVAVLDVVHPHH